MLDLNEYIYSLKGVEGKLRLWSYLSYNVDRPFSSMIVFGRFGLRGL